MKQHLQLISDATPCGRHAVVIVDRASWHMGNVSEGINNVSVIPLPPYSPELNPVEQVSRVWNVFRVRLIIICCNFILGLLSVLCKTR
ncbi:hypothetical protein HHO47_17415 [Pseudoalteromonas arctica]|uniref:Tc1-like transposase DDE domain-containing protein n=1 Tax=Pseudoalteromonas arctica TaxID=394751 RepID=A0A7Y0DVU2_9GAMM|nr:hypothetical protein [Pseudoalteromonas arctica]